MEEEKDKEITIGELIDGLTGLFDLLSEKESE